MVQQGFSFWFKDDAGRSMNAYKSIHENGSVRCGVEVFLEDCGLTTYGNGESMAEAWSNARTIKWAHLNEVEVLP